jgi:hypothetical protein
MMWNAFCLNANRYILCTYISKFFCCFELKRLHGHKMFVALVGNPSGQAQRLSAFLLGWARAKEVYKSEGIRFNQRVHNRRTCFIYQCKIFIFHRGEISYYDLSSYDIASGNQHVGGPYYLHLHCWREQINASMAAVNFVLILPSQQRLHLKVILSRLGRYMRQKRRVLVRMIGFISTVVTISLNHI